MRQLGPYTIVRELGRGGMGAVHVARDARLGREVALKVMHPGADPRVRERFLVEGRAQARVSHPNLVAIHEVDEERGIPFIAMALIAGESLEARVRREGPLEPALAVSIVRDLARGLHEAHEGGVLHRDVKPDNVLLSAADGRPLLTDFGLARDLQGTGGLTATGDVLGTPEFMPPEQADGQGKRVDRTADVYSLGATLYFALTGKAPFEGDSLHVVLVRVLSHDPVPPSKLQPGLPAALDALCLRAMAKEPAARHASSAALADDLERCLAAPAAPPPRRLWIAVPVLALVAAAALALELRPPTPPVVPDPIVASDGPGPATRESTAVVASSSTWPRVWRKLPDYPLGPRAYLQAVHDPRTKAVLVFRTTWGSGGKNLDTGDGSLHAFDGAWKPRADGQSSILRAGAAFTVDPARNVALLFGGCEPDTRLPSDRLSVLRPGGSWRLEPPGRAGPKPRRNAMLAWDPRDGGRVLLHGGVQFDDTYISDLWAWDGASWTDLAPQHHPEPPREQAAMAYDAGRRCLVLYGGDSRDTEAPRGDLWEWRDGDWQERKRRAGERWPPRVQRAAMIFDGERVIIVANDGSTWSWNGRRWHRPDVGGRVPPRERHALAWDADRGVAVLVGGETPEKELSDRSPLGDAWELGPR